MSQSIAWATCEGVLAGWFNRMRVDPTPWHCQWLVYVSAFPSQEFAKPKQAMCLSQNRGIPKGYSKDAWPFFSISVGCPSKKHILKKGMGAFDGLSLCKTTSGKAMTKHPLINHPKDKTLQDGVVSAAVQLILCHQQAFAQLLRCAAVRGPGLRISTC